MRTHFRIRCAYILHTFALFCVIMLYSGNWCCIFNRTRESGSLAYTSSTHCIIVFFRVVVRPFLKSSRHACTLIYFGMTNRQSPHMSWSCRRDHFPLTICGCISPMCVIRYPQRTHNNRNHIGPQTAQHYRRPYDLCDEPLHQPCNAVERERIIRAFIVVVIVALNVRAPF